MINVFENTARMRSERTFVTFVDTSGHASAYTYRQTRLAAAAIARSLRARGVRPGSSVVVDLPNRFTYVLLVLAAAYGGFTLVALNNRLSEQEKALRLRELSARDARVACVVDEHTVHDLLESIGAVFSHEGSAFAHDIGHANRVAVTAQQSEVEDAVHFAEHAAHLFDPDTRAVIMFTSGTTGHPKAVPLTWRQLTGSALASNEALGSASDVMWQAVLPFYHVGGLQVLVRSIMGGTPLVLYARFDATQLLRDAARYRATHVSVVDKMLQDMIAADEKLAASNAQSAQTGGADRPFASAPSRTGGFASPPSLARYQCILLGGGALNPQTITRALAAGARVYASYGMTETSSQIANMLITPQFTGGLRLLCGYSARIVEPDAEGFGRLAVRGPGVFSGYVNARAAFTVDEFFLTGDTAALHEGCIYVKERTDDMFVSGGENIYPAEIAQALRRIPGVGDAHVFGIADATWGRRPAAIVERSRAGVHACDVTRNAKKSLSTLTMPQVMMVDHLPRHGIGKIDRAAAEKLYAQRLEVRRVILHRIRLPFSQPFKTARATLDHTPAVIVEVVDYEGRIGLGECVAFETDWYLPETLDDDERYLREVAVPAIIGQAFSHPREAYDAMALLPGAPTHPMAISALEMALWDLRGRIQQRPLWALLRQEYARICQLEGARDQARNLPCAASFKEAQALVAAGAVVGMGSPACVVEAVHAAVSAGYRRVKLKIAPGQGLAAVRAAREAFPSLLITLDANGSFTAHDVDELRAYDELDIGWIEEPIGTSAHKPSEHSSYGRHSEHNECGERADALSRLAQLQRVLSTPICVDESFVTGDDAERILQTRELRCIAVKIAKFGGIEPALRFVVRAQAHGCEAWMGGMYDTGISKRVHAAFQTLPGVIVPGDIGATARYFDIDITEPPHTCARGYVLLNPQGHESGIGCDLNLPHLARVLIRRTVLE